MLTVPSKINATTFFKNYLHVLFVHKSIAFVTFRFVAKPDGSLSIVIRRVGLAGWAKKMHKFKKYFAVCNRKKSASKVRII